MNTNNCNYSTRNKDLCKYNLDCTNGIKSNQVQSPCPAPGENKILGCETNGSSQTCPVLLCNYEKDAITNENIFKRNFPVNKMCVLPDYRSSYNICKQYKELDTGVKCPRTKNTDMNPGKGSGIGFLSNIDIDSDLRLGYRSTLCPKNKYIQPLCDRVIVDNPYLLSNPTCQNYKYYQFPESANNYKSKCGNNQNNTIEFNVNLVNKSCIYDDARYNNMSNKKQPILYQYNSDMVENGKLQIGPERTNHSLENIWSNMTRRKNIQNTK